MTHEQLVRNLAEEMAAATHPETWESAKESLIEHFTPAARVALKRMRNTALRAVAIDLPAFPSAEKLNKFLFETGLVPDKTESNG